MVTDPFQRRYKRVQHRPPLRPATEARGGGKAQHSSAPIRLLAAALCNHAVLRQLREGVVPGLLLRYGRVLGNHAVRRLLARCRQPQPQPWLAGRAQRARAGAGCEAGADRGEAAGACRQAQLPGRLLREGSRGAEVSLVQERLNAHGAAPPLAVDGIFGPRTRSALLEYQKSHGLAPDGVVGPRSRDSLEGPTRIGGSSGTGPGAGGGGPGSKVSLYDTGGWSFAAPVPGTTMDRIRDRIKEKQDRKPTPDLGRTVTVTGSTGGGDEELYLWSLLLQRAERRFWGSEIDLVIPIGPAPKGGGAAPVGQVTVRIDGAGNAAAELMNRGGVAKPAAFKDEAAAKAALVKDFGCSAVTDGSAAWTLEELNKAHAALSRLPAADRTALRGVELVRDATLADESGRPLAGRIDFSMQLATGAATASRSQALRLADSAFAGDDFSFIGGKGNAAPGSFEVILHEAGHAVEGKALREAQFARLQGLGQLNAANRKVSDVVNAFNPEMRSAFAKARGYTREQQGSCQPFLSAIDAATRAIDSFARGDDPSRHAFREAAAAKALALRDDRRGKLPAGHPAAADFAKTVALQDDWFRSGKERAPVQAASRQAELDEAAAADPRDRKRSRHLRDFVELVNANKIPPLTDYARKNWPGHPEEFFAEAYSLWLNDPDFLAANAAPLKSWFDAGGHRL